MMLIERKRPLKDLAGAVTSGPPENAEKAPIDSLGHHFLLSGYVQRLPTSSQTSPGVRRAQKKKPAVAMTAGFTHPRGDGSD
jgi:hypothetical protein